MVRKRGKLLVSGGVEGQCLVCTEMCQTTFFLHDLFGKFGACAATCCRGCMPSLLVYSIDGRCPWCREELWCTQSRIQDLQRQVDEQNGMLQMYSSMFNNILRDTSDLVRVLADLRTQENKLSDKLEYVALIGSVLFICCAWTGILLSL